MPKGSDSAPRRPGIRFCETLEVVQAQLAKVRGTSQLAAVVIKDRLPGRDDAYPVQDFAY